MAPRFFSGDPRVFIPAVIALIVLSVASINFLEARFDRADLDRSATLVRNYQLGEKSIEQILIARHGDAATGQLIWSAEVKSSCAGIVRVSAQIETACGRALYEWDVLTVESRIYPANEAARALFVAAQTQEKLER